MTTTNLGRIGFVPQGNYVPGNTYKMLDVVRYNNATYTCTITPTTTTPVDSSSWQLIASDGATGASGPAESVRLVKTFNYVGTLISSVGNARWYPAYDVTIRSVYAVVSVPSTTLITIDILKNGISILSPTLLTITAGTYISTKQTISITANALTDYFTVNIVASNGSNLSVSLIYQ